VSSTTTRRLATYGAVVVGSAVTLAAASATGLAAYFTRRVVTPVTDKPDDLEIISVGGDRVVLSVTPDTVVPGQYGLWLSGGRGHARIGEILARDDGTVTRTVTSVDAGVLEPGPARFNQYYVAGDPTQAWGLAHEEVIIHSEIGELPCWLVRPETGAGARDGGPMSGVWAVLVHGRGATREECLRGIPVLHGLGVTTMVPSYRNDRDAPGDPGGRYHFGGTEWRDVDAAVAWAIDHGATKVVLMGWSMGGAIALQLVSRSALAGRVQAVVLDAPVVDWGDVLNHTARVNGLPTPVGGLGRAMVRNRLWHRVIGLGEPVDLRGLNWVRRARELDLPILLIHSEDDDIVPAGPSRRLAEARPDIVTFAPWTTARHTKEWNVDPELWEGVVSAFLRRVLP
jgi:uncharacterized protein